MDASQIAPIAIANLTSPPALAFALGLVATAVLRASLRLPAPVYTALSMYLLLSIGIKGGVALRNADLVDLIAPAAAAVALGMAIPFLVFRLLRWVTRLSALDRGAVAAHYGSTSLVTFTAAIALLETLKIPFEGYVATLLTIMEIPGIIVGLVLARSGQRASSAKPATAPAALAGVGAHTAALAHASASPSAHASTAAPVGVALADRPAGGDQSASRRDEERLENAHHLEHADHEAEDERDWRQALREVVTGPSVLLLVGGLLLGAATGPTGYARIEPFFIDLFAGVLTLFLLHLGCVAGAELRRIRGNGVGLVAFALVFPLFAGAAGVLAGTATGLSAGGAALLGVLCASASYIAAPAAVNLALPRANEGLCLTASLGITFPFNLAIGIPVLIALAEMVSR